MNSENTVITFVANSGISIEIGCTVIWVDALHNEGLPGFSTLNDCMRRFLEMKYSVFLT